MNINKFNENLFKINRPIVCIQGLGFVGAAMSVAVAEANDFKGDPYFNIIGVDLANPKGLNSIEKLNQGIFPADSNDIALQQATLRSKERGNLIAVTDESAYGYADIVIVDVNLDLGEFDSNQEPTVNFTNFNKAIDAVASRIKPGCLVLVETTVPPGTCEKIVYPKLNDWFKKRNLPADSFFLAHSYERVMPGEEYLHSITNFWRVYSGINEASAKKCEEFLMNVVNTKDYPMVRLLNTTSSETAKVLENSYRATNIAFIEEWGRFAENVGVDLFSVISAIRQRPTHNNIRQPGFGVGGYCLTKDPLFGRVAATQLFNLPSLDFPFSRKAVEINNAMPLVSFELLKNHFDHQLKNRKVLLLGISYRPDVGDTRYSPSEVFARTLIQHGVRVEFHDPLVKNWEEMNLSVSQDLPEISDFDAIVFAVGHKEYRELKLETWITKSDILILDANNVLSDEQIGFIKKRGLIFKSIGRGAS